MIKAPMHMKTAKRSIDQHNEGKQHWHACTDQVRCNQTTPSWTTHTSLAVCHTSGPSESPMALPQGRWGARGIDKIRYRMCMNG